MRKNPAANTKSLSDESEAASVPVWVDSKKSDRGFTMTRCTYFTIEWDGSMESSDDLEILWVLHPGRGSISFALQSLVGIITGPLKGEREFGSVRQIDETFDSIEEHPALMVDSGELWLPNELLNSCHDQGMVYRLSWRLFMRAYSFERGEINTGEFQAWCERRPGEISYSRREEQAFAAWQEAHIKAAREIFPKDGSLALDYREVDSRN